MKYRDILGYSKSKEKVIEEQSEPKKTVVDEIKQELNEWNDKNFKNMPKRWSSAYSSQDGLTEHEQQLKEVGSAVEYRPYIKKIEKAYIKYEAEVEKLELFLYRKKKLKKPAAALNLAFHAYVGKFVKFFHNKFIKGLL